MKKVVGLLLVLAMVSSAFATGFDKGSATNRIKQNVGETTYASTATWTTQSPIPGIIDPTGVNGSVWLAPWVGVKYDTTANVDFWHSELAQAQYGSTVYLEQDYGDGSSLGLFGTVTTPVLSGVGKFLPQNGTMNVNGHTVWTDKMQTGSGSYSRTKFGTAADCVVYAGQNTLIIGQGGAVRVRGTEATGNSGGNMVFGYGSSIDSYAKISGTGVLSGVERTTVEGVTSVVGGRTLEFGRSNNASNMVDFEISGSQATVEAWSLKMNGHSALTSTIRYITDASGVSAITTYGGGANAVQFGAKTFLFFKLGAAVTEGQVFTLINNDNATATMNTTAGKFKVEGAGDLLEGYLIQSSFEGIDYLMAISYVGGVNGNDVTLTVVPEPATMGLLGLGSLILVRRRRA